MPPPASASAVRAYCRRSFHSEPAMQATPTTVPSTTRSQGGTSPCSIEYLKKSSPASASATPPSPAAARTPKSCSQSISTRGAETGGGAAGRGAGAGGGGGAGRSRNGGAGERLEGARHAVHPHPSRDQRRDGDAPLGDGGERARELLRRVAEHELQRQLLVDAVHGADAIVLHADAGDHHARLARRVAHELVEEPRHADALEEDRRARTGGGLPGVDRALPSRFDDPVLSTPIGEEEPSGPEVGRPGGDG